MNPFLATDGYKTGHHIMYPEGTTVVYSNFTPRSNKYAPKGCNMVVSFGQQMVMRQIKEMFDEHFFGGKWGDIARAGLKEHPESPNTLSLKIKNKVCQEIKKEYSLYLNTDYDVSHIEDLWDLGYLPIKVKALPEGTLVPIGVPVLTIYNTLPEFYWLTNFLETLISNLLWKPMTSETIAHQYKKKLMSWAKKTDKNSVGFVEFQGHDFSMRGMDSIAATVSSGLGHATSFLGSDSLPVIHGARKYYDMDDSEFVVGSVNATEHSVMCAGTKDDELGTFRYLMEKFPTGILSIVSDTWDLWKVCTEYLPTLKDEIMARDGKIVIRPDSGDPVDILCGKKPKSSKYKFFHKYTEQEIQEWLNISVNEFMDKILEEDKEYIYELDDFLPSMSDGRDYTPDYKDGKTCYIKIGDRILAFEVYTGDCLEATWAHTINETDVINIREIDVVGPITPESKGVIELLWDTFGGTTNDQGYKVLDSHIGAIYGDSITVDRAEEICQWLAAKGFASTNIVLGIGSFTYQFNTRDTFGFAMKATYVEVNGEARPIFKDPITDDGIKKSAMGLLKVERCNCQSKKYELHDHVSWLREAEGELQTIFEDGSFQNAATLTEIRNKLNSVK